MMESPDIDTVVIRTSKGIVSKVFWEGEPLLINDILNDPEYHNAEGTG